MITKINDIFMGKFSVARGRLVLTILFSYLLPLTSCLLFSCSSDDGYQSRLRELLLEDMTFTCEQGTQEQIFRHEDLSAYTVACKTTWCTPRLDINNCKLVVTVTANDTYDARTDTVTLTDTKNQATRYITVTQARRTGLFIDKTFFEPSMDGDTIKANLKSNVSYEVQIPKDCDWVTLPKPTAKTRGLEPSVITLIVSKNNTYKEREAVINVVSKDEGLTDKITIHQPFNMVFKADSTAFEVPMEGRDFIVNIESNISYEVTIPDTCKWITQTNAGKTRATETKALTFHTKENTGYHERNGVIILSNKEAGVSINITVHQPFTAVLKADKKAFEVPMEGGSVTINMESNITYDVKIPDGCDWITRPSAGKTRGVQPSTVELKVAENKSYKNREAVVVISNKEAGAETKITITQPFTTVFKVDKTAFDVPMEGGTVTVNLESNISYNVSIPSDCNWITMPTSTRRRTRAATTTPIVFRATENTTYKDREAVITISNKEAGAEIKIYIHQPFTPTFKVDKTDAEVPMEGGTVTASVESNVSYDVKIPADCNWVTLASNGSRTRAVKTSVVMFRVAANTTGRNRSTTITIGNATIGVSAGLTITQPFTANFNVDATPLEIDERGGTLGVSVAANVPVSVQSLNDWISIGSKTDVGDGYWTQQIVVSPLTDKVAQRTGSVKFLYPTTNQAVTVAVTQNRTLFIKDTSILLTEDGQKEFNYTNSQSKTVTWTSSNPNVATIVSTTNEKYTVKPVANGKTKITVRTADGKYSDTVNVVVDIPEPEPEEPEKETEENTSDNPGDKQDGETQT